MAKVPAPGQVKTRLVRPGFVGEAAAAEIAWALLECTVARLAVRMRVVLALDGDERREAVTDRVGAARGLKVVEQGDGDLGVRLDRVWRAVAPRDPIAFFGIDSPDVPAASLAAIGPAVADADVAVGPTDDGGYWTLAARVHRPEVLRRIDWGSGRVYDQTCLRASEACFRLVALPVWRDVDHPDDVRSLRQRLAAGPDPGDAALARLAERLDAILSSPDDTR